MIIIERKISPSILRAVDENLDLHTSTGNELLSISERYDLRFIDSDRMTELIKWCKRDCLLFLRYNVI